MLRIAAFIALLAIAAPAAAEPRRVIGERDGISYDYTAQLDSDGSLVLRGVFLNTTERFSFTVDPNGRVRGYVDNRPVRFDVGRKTRDDAVASLKSRDALVADRTAAR